VMKRLVGVDFIFRKLQLSLSHFVDSQVLF
jgi:hypothetical protein